MRDHKIFRYNIYTYIIHITDERVSGFSQNMESSGIGAPFVWDWAAAYGVPDIILVDRLKNTFF